MKLKGLGVAVAVFAAFVMIMGASTTTAHVTKNNRRTKQKCRELGASDKKRACLACLARSNAHHFHPAYPRGKRCRPNNGKP